MTKKTYTSKEINIKTNKLVMEYSELFSADKMSFAEYNLITSIITRVQLLFDEKSDGDSE